MRKRGFTAVELVLVIVVLAIVVGVTMWQVDKRRQAMLREESAANLKVLRRAVEGLISSEDGGIKASGNFQPLPLSSTPGLLTPEWTPSQMQKLLKSPDRFAFISPAHPEAERMRREALTNPGSALTDASYWYLGYALPNEEAGLAFIDAYRKAVKKTGLPPKEHIILQSQIELVGPDYTREIYSLAPLDKPVVDLKYYGYRPVFPIPIFIERPGLQRGGSNVLFEDGHVEFMEYPGKWPMTEKFIQALESLDALKEKE